jgi:tetrahydromethanopterin S-methyltransferase subunit G
MGAIEDTRKVLQDFLAPELRAIAVRLEALEKRIDGRLDSVDRKIDDVDRRAEKRHDSVMLALGRLVDYNELRERLARLESKESAHQ